MRYKKAESSFKTCPGGGPQGGLLTGILFILQVRNAGRPCPALPSLKKEQITQSSTNHPFHTMQVSDTIESPSIRNESSLLPPDIDKSESPSLRKELSLLSQVANTNENPSIRKTSIYLPPCHTKESLHKKTFVDDITLLEKIQLSKLRDKKRIIVSMTASI